MIDSKGCGTAQPAFQDHRKENGMGKLYSLILKLARDERGQDLVEYALLAGFVAVAAGAILPPISDSITIIFSKMASVVGNVALQ